MSTFYIKQGDTSPAIEATLTDAAGDPVNVTGGTVRFHMNTRAGVNLVDAAATIVDGANGEVKYSWAAGDTATAGQHVAEFEVTYADTTVESFPNRQNIVVEITEQLA